VPDEQPEAAEGAREERLARNEVFFREANEILERDAQQYGRRPLQIICECSTAGCVERVTLTQAEYEHARSNPTWFIVRPGHEDATVEVVIERRDVYLVVAKLGVAGAIARDENPR
jgi:hypothetical protein